MRGCMTLLITSAQRREISSGRLDARLVWTCQECVGIGMSKRCVSFFFGIGTGRLGRKKTYIGDDLYNASCADMFLPTKKKVQSVVCDSCFVGRGAGEGGVRDG